MNQKKGGRKGTEGIRMLAKVYVLTGKEESDVTVNPGRRERIPETDVRLRQERNSGDEGIDVGNAMEENEATRAYIPEHV